MNDITGLSWISSIVHFNLEQEGIIAHSLIGHALFQYTKRCIARRCIYYMGLAGLGSLSEYYGMEI